MFSAIARPETRFRTVDKSPTRNGVQIDVDLIGATGFIAADHVVASADVGGSPAESIGRSIYRYLFDEIRVRYPVT